MKTLVNGINMAYGLEGDGLPVVFIHGFPLSRNMWSHQVEDVRSLCTTVALDLRGHGESDKPDAPFTIDQLADDVLSLVSELGLGKAVFVGHSMGGYVTLRAYSRWPEAFAGIVLVNSRADADTPEAREARLKTANRVRTGGGEKFREDFADRLLSDESRLRRPELYSELRRMMEESPDRILARSLEAMAGRPDSTPVLPRIIVPSLIIAGAEDKIIPLTAAHALKAGISGSKLIVISGAGHMANMEEPAAFNSKLREFLHGMA